MKREISSEDMEEITGIIKEQFEKVSIHYGEPYLNTATVAGIFRMILKEYDKRHGRMTEKNVKPYVNAMEYW